MTAIPLSNGCVVVDKVENLKTYLTVIDMGGINAAAAELGIAKSAVSRRLSDLEKRLRVNLVDRGTRRFEPTAVGVEYARRARLILSSLDELDASVAPGTDSPSLTIRSSSAIIARKLVPAMSALLGKTPKTTVRFVADDAAAGSDRDILVGHGPGTAGDTSRPLFRSSLVVCASPEYLAEQSAPERPQQLDGHRAIAIAGDSPAIWRLANGISRNASVSVVVPDPDTAAAAAVAGLGLAQLPDFVAADALADGRLVRVLEGHDPAPTQVFATFSKSAELDVRKFVDALATALV